MANAQTVGTGNNTAAQGNAEMEKIAAFFGRHVVAWQVIEHEVAEDGTPIVGKGHSWNGSGFLLSVRGEWLLVTAGHVLDSVLNVRTEGRIITHSWLFDCWSPNHRHVNPLVLPINHERCAVVGTGDDGAPDIGFIWLGPLLAEALKANEMEPLAEPGWRDVPDDCDYYFLYGVPAELMKPQNERNGIPRVFEPSAVMLRIDKIADPNLSQAKSYERFFGQISPLPLAQTGSSLSDIGGMSGGPIFGFKRLSNGETRYWPIAVQSAWYSDRRIIIAEFFPRIAALIEGMMNQAFGKNS